MDIANGEHARSRNQPPFSRGKNRLDLEKDRLVAAPRLQDPSDEISLGFLRDSPSDSLYAGPARAVSLDSLDLSNMTSGWGTPRAGFSIAGKPLSIAGKKYTHGVGTHAESAFRLNLGGNASRFSAEVGVDDGTENDGMVEFVVLGDGTPLWKSGKLAGGQPAKSVNVDLSGVQILELVVTAAGNGEKTTMPTGPMPKSR
jgi:hypothetical protein